MLLSRFLILLFNLKLWTDAWNCNSDFGDIASKTVRSVVVFEGRAKRWLTRPVDHSEQASSVVFRVGRILKGNREVLTSGTSVVAVGKFQGVDDPANCVASNASVSIGGSYIVFISNRTSTDDDELTRTSKRRSRTTLMKGQQKLSKKKPVIPAFTISGRPELTSSEAIDTVLKHNCSKCVRPPTARISATEMSAKIGDRLRLRCRTSGRPDSLVTWFKDGSPLTESSQRQITSNKKRSSRLQLRAVSASDFGVYQCMARNVLGVSNASSCTVWMKQESSTVKPHAAPCADQSFCLNGGSCFILRQLNILFCQCRIGFEGERCEIKDTGIRGAVLARTEEHNNLDTESKSLILTTVSAVVLSVLLSLASVFLLKWLCWSKANSCFKSSAWKSSSSSSALSVGHRHRRLVAGVSSSQTINSPLVWLPFADGRRKATGLDSFSSKSSASVACDHHFYANKPPNIPLYLSSSSSSSPSSSSSSLLPPATLLVPRLFSRRQRLQAVSESFDSSE